MKKVNLRSPFCPKSTINLTYLCYGSANICAYYKQKITFRPTTLFLDEIHK